MHNLKFSITIPAYKANFLKEAIESCLSQTYQNFELIIVDDCSPEDLVSIISPFLSDQRVKYYRNLENCGAEHVVDNWNICLGYCTGDWVICMGDDDRLMPHCLEEYTKAIMLYPSVDLLHARVRQIDENGDLITILPERPQLQSAYSNIIARMRGGEQYIGDFCFKTKRLRQEGGFYSLPFAWGSDDITTFNCATPNGVANVNVPTFCYRISRYSISNSRNENEKLQAINMEEEWLINYISNQSPQTELAVEELRQLKVSVHRGMDVARCFIINNSLKNSIFNIIRWTFLRKKYKISGIVLLRSLYNAFVNRA